VSPSLTHTIPKRFSFRLRLLVLILLEGTSVQRLRAQVEALPRTVESNPLVYFEAISFASDLKDKSRLEMYVQMPYEELRFVKEGEEYVGRYDLTLNILTESEVVTWQKNMLVEVRSRDFVQTTSRHMYSLKQLSADLDPGTYELQLQVRDEDSKNTANLKRTFIVSNYSRDSVSLSDIMLVNHVTTSGDRKTIVPNISGTIPNTADELYLFCELYMPKKADSARFAYRITNSQHEDVFRRAVVLPLSGARTQAFLRIDSLNIPMGTYVATIEAEPYELSGLLKTKLASTSRKFSVRWTDLPFTITDIDHATDQMRYIAKDAEMEYIRDGKTLEEKKARFLQFWAKRNPNPQSPRNTLLEEYYLRVDQANKMFSHYAEGWKSDMGMVFIRYGPPENVERHPFETGTRPYEIWFYYQLQAEFVFVDETGFGDYRLRYPTTDLWGRVR
jgi:GWxTD domain-containing protein